MVEPPGEGLIEGEPDDSEERVVQLTLPVECREVAKTLR